MNIENCVCGEPVLKENINLEESNKRTIISYDCEECNYGFEVTENGSFNIESAVNIVYQAYKTIKST